VFFEEIEQNVLS